MINNKYLPYLITQRIEKSSTSTTHIGVYPNSLQTTMTSTPISVSTKMIFVGSHLISKNLKINTDTCLIKSHDLIKPNFVYDISWSSGMIANLLLNTNNIYKKKNLNAKNARREWGLWKYIITLWILNNNYFLIQLVPMAIRTRRFLKSLQPVANFISIRFSWELYKTPKRSIKRWLKKKYTTQSWR